MQAIALACIWITRHRMVIARAGYAAREHTTVYGLPSIAITTLLTMLTNISNWTVALLHVISGCELVVVKLVSVLVELKSTRAAHNKIA